MTVKDTLAQLVSIDSVSARSNREIVDYLARRCESIGFAVRRLPYPDENGIEKTNLVALANGDDSNAPQVELALVGHTDTVPYDSDWKEALMLTGRAGKLFGRGACDTKAFIAAALTAVESIGVKSLAKPLAFVFTADEEVGLVGAKRLAEQNALKVIYAIVGEPTSLQPMRAGKGYCLAEIVVKGREAHSAYPALGSSAIFHAARLVSRIEAIAKELATEQHSAFDPAYTTLNVGLIRGGSAKNVIPGSCRLTLEWRPIPGQSPDRVLDLLRKAVAEEQKVNSNVECVIDANRADDSFETPANSRIVTLLEELTGKPSGTVSFGTEAPQMMALGAEAVVFGPGDIRVAHRTGEFVPIAELEESVEILRQVILRLCN
jgi:acetylornithine deacetylase